MIRHDEENRTFDCEPTLTDTQVLKFCREGFLMLEGLVPDEINRRTFAYLDKHPSKGPSTIILEDWFRDNVLLEPQVAGAVRSILGRDVGLPVLMSNHRVQCPAPLGDWHHDADSLFGPRGQLPPSILLSAGCPHRDGTNRGASGLASAGITARRGTSRRRVNHRPRRIGLHHDLLHHAP